MTFQSHHQYGCLIKLPHVFRMSRSCELGLVICKEKVVSSSSSGYFSIRTVSTGLAPGIEPVTGTAGQHSTNYMYMYLLQGNTFTFSALMLNATWICIRFVSVLNFIFFITSYIEPYNCTEMLFYLVCRSCCKDKFTVWIEW